MNDKSIDDVFNYLKTPRDISNLPLEEQANIITLAFIGYCAKPIGISKELLEKCCEAFNNNRGKIEKEAEAVLKVLKEE